MKTDWYTKSVLAVIVIALAVIALNPRGTLSRWLEAMGPSPAEAQRQYAAETLKPEMEIAVPKSWGKLVGVTPGGAFFEASDGTIRELSFRAFLLPTVIKRQ